MLYLELVESFKSNTLECLEDDYGSKITAIGKLLETSTCVKRIHFCNKTNGDEILAAISDALKLNKSVDSLYMWNCQVSDVGVQSLTRALTQNTTLKYIWFYKNNITDVGACALFEALSGSNEIKKSFQSSICYVSLTHNQISKATTVEAINNFTKYQFLEVILYGNPVWGMANCRSLFWKGKRQNRRYFSVYFSALVWFQCSKRPLLKSTSSTQPNNQQQQPSSTSGKKTPASRKKSAGNVMKTEEEVSPTNAVAALVKPMIFDDAKIWKRIADFVGRTEKPQPCEQEGWVEEYVKKKEEKKDQ